MESAGRYSLDKLIAGRGYNMCSSYITEIDVHTRTELFKKLAHERLTRKVGEISAIFDSTLGDWNQTLHVMLFRFIGGTHNRIAAERLASIATAHILMRENSSVQNLEALLLGCSGLLHLYSGDSYVEQLKVEFNHLVAKYNLTPMRAEEWRTSGFYINNHPTLRLAQLAACLHANTINMNSITACCTRRDVQRLFAAEASSYWVNNFAAGIRPEQVSRRIGSFKSDILGINLVAPILIAYAAYTNSDRLALRAYSLLEDIPAENNTYIQQWNSVATITRCAMESQALLQLSKEYCERQRCHECPLAEVLNR